jgi:hypothetical protein
MGSFKIRIDLDNTWKISELLLGNAPPSDLP